MTIVNVVDAPCGYGKTSWAIQYMNSVPDGHYSFIYVTPFLSEVDRIKKHVTTRKFYDPHDKSGFTKLDDLHLLLAQGKNICTTHTLFKNANDETKELLRVNNYILILDEVINVVEQVPLRTHDLKVMFDSNLIYQFEDEKGLKYIRWNKEKLDYNSSYNKVKAIALTNNLMHLGDTALVWNFPCDVFRLFKDVYILTYLFRGQLQKSYFDIHGIRYKYLSVINRDGNYTLISYQNRIPLEKGSLHELISVYDGPLNNIGDNFYSLSMNWFKEKKNGKLMISLKNHARNYFMNLKKVKVDETLWTTYKGGDKEIIKKKIALRGYANSFISINQRATNEYDKTYVLAYLANRFMRRIEVNFFEQYGVKVDEDVWALSELVQWIWRSRIRKGEPISIYIPSSRMRKLFKQYLTSDQFEIAPETAIVNEPPTDWHI